MPVSDFGIVAFSDCAFNGQPISAYDWNQIDMTSEYSDALVDATSALSPDGASFTVTTDLHAAAHHGLGRRPGAGTTGR